MTALERTIRYQDGSTQPYTPPRDTCDMRAVVCGPHHPACDCREARHAEDLAEMTADRDKWRAFAQSIMWRVGYEKLADLMADQHAAIEFYRQRRRDGLL